MSYFEEDASVRYVLQAFYINIPDRILHPPICI